MSGERVSELHLLLLDLVFHQFDSPKGCLETNCLRDYHFFNRLFVPLIVKLSWIFLDHLNSQKRRLKWNSCTIDQFIVSLFKPLIFSLKTLKDFLRVSSQKKHFVVTIANIQNSIDDVFNYKIILRIILWILVGKF